MKDRRTKKFNPAVKFRCINIYMRMNFLYFKREMESLKLMSWSSPLNQEPVDWFRVPPGTAYKTIVLMYSCLLLDIRLRVLRTSSGRLARLRDYHSKQRRPGKFG